ncbi:MAG TPA: hypothetical protein VFC54_13610 [Pseudolabrys sp.]|nr:hypothetical protein [Pseudolabrys sp.]
MSESAQFESDPERFALQAAGINQVAARLDAVDGEIGFLIGADVRVAALRTRPARSRPIERGFFRIGRRRSGVWLWTELISRLTAWLRKRKGLRVRGLQQQNRHGETGAANEDAVSRVFRPRRGHSNLDD